MSDPPLNRFGVRTYLDANGITDGSFEIVPLLPDEDCKPDPLGRWGWSNPGCTGVEFAAAVSRLEQLVGRRAMLGHNASFRVSPSLPWTHITTHKEPT